MKCPYCSESVVGEKDIVVVVGEGPAHRICHERAVIGQRVFSGLNLPALSDEQLHELNDMVRMELNARQPAEELVELFG